MDNELRLITPTDPVGSIDNSESQSAGGLSASGDGLRYYQLTHDFLVPALNDWLNKKQRETRRGRAEIRLAEAASLWSSKSVSKFEPTCLEWLSIRSFSSPNAWTKTERAMMRSAGFRHLRNAMLISFAAFMLLGLSVWSYRKAKVQGLVAQLGTANTTEVNRVVDVLSSSRWLAPSELEQELTRCESPEDEFPYRLGLLPHDARQKEWLCDYALKAPVPQTIAIGRQFQSLGIDLPDQCMKLVQGDARTSKEWMRSAILLAHLVDAGQGDKVVGVLAANDEQIVESVLAHLNSSPQDFNALQATFHSIGKQLRQALAKVALEPDESPQRVAATGLLVDYCKDEPRVLLDYALVSAPAQYPAFFGVLDPELGELKDYLTEIAFQQHETGTDEDSMDFAAMRQASAVALLQRLSVGSAVWPMLQATPRPYARSYLIDRLARLGRDFESLVVRFAREPNPSSRQALLHAMGNFDWNDLSSARQTDALAAVKDAFQNDPSIAVHSAAQWLLVRKGQVGWVYEQIDLLSQVAPDPRKDWYVDSHGHTMAVFDARQVPKIGRIFAVSTLEVSVGQYQAFRADHEYYEYRSPTPDCPVGLVDWFAAIDYCRWISQERNVSESVYPPDFPSDAVSREAIDTIVDSGEYRLPTSAEWMYVCRASTESFCYFGKNDSLVSDWIWHWENSVDKSTNKVRYWPGDHRPPNPFGMFAMYDGVREWGMNTIEQIRRPIMGMHSGSDKSSIFTDKMNGVDLARSRNGMYGFRVAKTITDN